MQFPVPQFTDVEDKIIGPLTIKQFGIIFGAGVVIFLAFSASKSVLVLIFFFLLVGLPALALAFAKLNGRPIYNMIGYLVSFVASPKVLVFHKEGSAVAEAPVKAADKPALKKQVEVSDPKQRLSEINKLLQEKAREERELLE